MLLVALGLIRVVSIYQVRLSSLIGFIGYALIAIHINALEERWGIPKKYKWISNGIFILLLVPLAYWLAFPGLQ